MVAKQVVALGTSQKSSSLDRIYSKERFVNEFSTVLDGSTELSDNDIEALLIYLSRDTNDISYDGKVYSLLNYFEISKTRKSSSIYILTNHLQHRQSNSLLAAATANPQ